MHPDGGDRQLNAGNMRNAGRYNLRDHEFVTKRTPELRK